MLRQLRQGLTKCYAIAFENRGSVADATITPHTLSFVKKLVATFGIGIENIANSASGSFGSAASESLARRAQATAQDPVIFLYLSDLFYFFNYLFFHIALLGFPADENSIFH